MGTKRKILRRILCAVLVLGVLLPLSGPAAVLPASAVTQAEIDDLKDQAAELEDQQDALEAEDKCGFTVRSCTTDYKLPAVLDDALAVTCELRDAKGASAVMFQEIYRGDTLLATVEVKVAYVNLGRKRPVRIPSELLNKLSCL